MNKYKEFSKSDKHMKALFRNGCLRKFRYQTKEQAERRAETVSKREGIAMKKYYCPACFGWHIAKEKDAKETQLPTGTGGAQSTRSPV